GPGPRAVARRGAADGRLDARARHPLRSHLRRRALASVDARGGDAAEPLLHEPGAHRRAPLHLRPARRGRPLYRVRGAAARLPRLPVVRRTAARDAARRSGVRLRGRPAGPPGLTRVAVTPSPSRRSFAWTTGT